MTSNVGPAPAPAAPVLTSASLRSRLLGLGSVFGKTLRDSRRAVLVVAVLLGFTFIGISNAIVSEFSTTESRREMEALVAAVPPILQGLAGKAVNVGTLGGYLSYKYGTFFPLIIGLWSILALSGTLAAEARRGSLEFVATTGMTRRRIAIQKLSGHLVGMSIAVIVTFVALVVVGQTVEGLPGDEISVEAAAGYAIWLGLIGLAGGAVAFALAPFVGRGSAAGVAGATMFGGFILSGYQSAIPAIAPLANLTWWGWTADHIPLAGQFDWASLVPVAVFVVVLLAVGIEAFVRRDIGATNPIPAPSLPRALVGLRGPTGRAFGHGLPSTLAWGIGIGVYGLVIAGSGGAFLDQLAESPDFARLLGQVFPGFDLGSVGGFLQLLYVEFGMILAGLAAATLVGAWASDETSGRLEFLLATPLTRRRWAIAGGVAIIAGAVVVTAISALGIALGAAMAGSAIVQPVVGSLVLGLYAAAMGGVGVAIGGLLRTSVAAPAVAIIVVVGWFVSTLGPAFGLPDMVRDLALTAHYGFTMLGQWDPVGVAASVVLAVGGVLLGAWGFGRRDLQG